MNTDYKKKLKSFPVKGAEVERQNIYNGENSLTTGDVEITGWNNLSKVLGELAEK